MIKTSAVRGNIFFEIVIIIAPDNVERKLKIVRDKLALINASRDADASEAPVSYGICPDRLDENATGIAENFQQTSQTKEKTAAMHVFYREGKLKFFCRN